MKLTEGTDGDFSNGLGNIATTVSLDTTTTDLDTAIHELLHVLGMVRGGGGLGSPPSHPHLLASL